MKKVSIIVPHYNQPALLLKCLHALESQDYPGPVQIIISDNATPGGIEDIRNSFPDVHFINAPQKGAACARNAALAIAEGDIVAFTDSDCQPARDWISAGVEGLEITGADLVGGAVDVTVEKPSAPTSVEVFEKVFGFRQKLYIEKKHFSVTANLFAHGDAVRETGLFTNGLSEDVDWCHRARSLGFRLSFYRKCVVSHPARQAWRDLKIKWSRLILEQRTGCQQAWGGGIAGLMRWYLLAMLIAVSALPHAALLICNPAAGTLQSRLGATGVLFRIRIWRCVTMLKLGLTKELQMKPDDPLPGIRFDGSSVKGELCNE
ncbi:glycosyltransferase family 2 protein [Parvularcula sp. IMCC14364]|uniref:glycosyltransferase family 2 protein n=1 Tax=Parvularcula sp. IMCC14364 TaxID=3067902 RepID=UPI0027412EB3|nr:glycosyltransferase [Parvularcula sp. IMCC14364]